MTRQEILAIAKPILFNTEMVCALLEGRKTVTRRVVKPQPLFKTHRKYVFADDVCLKKWQDCDNIIATYRYQPGDYLYVRETWAEQGYNLLYKANFTDEKIKAKTYWFEKEQVNLCDLPKWCPSIHMPKEAARIFLRVIDVWVDQLQNITEEQAVSEGAFIHSPDFIPTYHYDKSKCHYPGSGWTTAKESFLWGIWNSTIKKPDLDRYGWRANPWVWVIEFERVVV